MDIVNLLLSVDETVYRETPYLLEVGHSREGLWYEMILVVSAVKVYMFRRIEQTRLRDYQ